MFSRGLFFVRLSQTTTQTTTMTTTTNNGLSERQRAALAAANRGENVFVTGSAGVGKSFVLRLIVRDALARKKRCQTLAPTGIAAVNVGGRTIHSFLRASPDMVKQGKFSKKNPDLCELDVLVIDEVSMLSPELFAYLNGCAQASASSKAKAQLPMGGLQVVFVGDFAQLPPVRGARDAPSPFDFAFELPLWRELFTPDNHVQLVEVFRQRDKAFVAILNEMRMGRCSAETARVFSGISQQMRKDPGPIRPTELHGRRNDVNSENNRQLGRLAGASVTFIVSLRFADGKQPGSAPQLQRVRERVLKDMQVEDVTVLKVGAQVMLLCNKDTAGGLGNGSRGVVVGFDADTNFPYVDFADQKKVLVEPHVWEVDLGKTSSGKVHVLGIPLRLAYALTIHKSQGQSIDVLSVSCGAGKGGMWEYGQCYTAISRATTLDTLMVKGFLPDHVRVHPKVVTFYSTLPSGK